LSSQEKKERKKASTVSLHPSAPEEREKKRKNEENPTQGSSHPASVTLGRKDCMDKREEPVRGFPHLISQV